MKRVFVKNEHTIALIKAVYDNSRPFGLGFLHWTNAPLDTETAEQLISSDPVRKIRMDYVNGRACKFSANALNDGVVCFWGLVWPDHSEGDMQNVLSIVPHEVIT